MATKGTKTKKSTVAKKISGSPKTTATPKQSTKPDITYIYRKDAFNKVKIA
jgi:hypothetical protein